MENNEESTRLIENVRTFDHDIQKFESNIKTIKEQLKDDIEKLPEHDEVEGLTDKLKTAKEALKQAMFRIPGYNDRMEQLADEKDALKSARLNMSDFLLGYYHETGERQIELADKDAREVILKGKLGKSQAFQTNLFAGGKHE